MKNIYYALAYYSVAGVSDPHEEIVLHQIFLKNKDAACRIYISEQGINGQFSAHITVAEEYMNWLKERPSFAKIHFKIHEIQENIYPRITVKYRKQLVALDYDVNLSLMGDHISPQEWKEKLLEGQSLILDVRNDYEWKVGHFEGATLPPLNTFREFPAYAADLAKTHDLETPVLMYCTGGIRCEFYSALLKEKGFEKVYQLDGGVIAYGQEVGQDLWKGKLFVFDDRLTIPISPTEQPSMISHCIYCNKPADIYYNCANVNCNDLFISCSECIAPNHCCCSDECQNSNTVRVYDSSRGNKPFGRKSTATILVSEMSE
ncbi:MAG: rhodanese-related sulfurtransferase [Victivallaceae bacterium]